MVRMSSLFLSILAKRICFQRTSAFDKSAQADKPLTTEELDIIKRLYAGEVPDAAYDPYEPTTEWFTSKQEVMPLSGAPEPKRRWIPSKWEKQKVCFLFACLGLQLKRKGYENCARHSSRPHCPLENKSCPKT